MSSDIIYQGPQAFEIPLRGLIGTLLTDLMRTDDLHVICGQVRRVRTCDRVLAQSDYRLNTAINEAVSTIRQPQAYDWLQDLFDEGAFSADKDVSYHPCLDTILISPRSVFESIGMAEDHHLPSGRMLEARLRFLDELSYSVVLWDLHDSSWGHRLGESIIAARPTYDPDTDGRFPPTPMRYQDQTAHDQVKVLVRLAADSGIAKEMARTLRYTTPIYSERLLRGEDNDSEHAQDPVDAISDCHTRIDDLFDRHRHGYLR